MALDYGLLFEVALVAAGGIGTYFVLQFRLSQVEYDLKHHSDKDDTLHKEEYEKHAKIHSDFIDKFNAGFKRLDAISDRVTILERDTSTHLDMPRAEERFVSHKELQLHINNIDNTIKHMDKNVEHMSGKLDELTKLLSTNIVKTLSGKHDG
jgi:hypothetical protein